MLTKEDLDQIAKLLKPIKEQLDTVEMKVEANHAQNKKDHAEIMEKLAESNEAHGKEQKELRGKIEHLEQSLPHAQS